MSKKIKIGTLQLNRPYSKTWHYEASVVIFVLFITVYLSGNQLLEYVGALAVFFTFMLLEIQDRSNEKEKQRAIPDNECFHLSPVYLYIKETLWISYFLLKGAHSALVGSFIFILYPLWRKIFRKYRPLV
jgi:hypothetical protein